MHPILYLISQFVITVLVIGFTGPRSVRRVIGIRSLGLILNIFCVAKCIPRCMEHMIRTPWAALVGGYSVTYPYHYIDVALLSCWSFEHNALIGSLVKPIIPEKKSELGTMTNKRERYFSRERLQFGFRIASSSRFVGTPYQVKNVPNSITTARCTFLLRTFITIVISYIVLDFISSSDDPDIALKYLTLSKIPLFARL